MTLIETIFATVVLLGMVTLFLPSIILPFFPETLKELGLSG